MSSPDKLLENGGIEIMTGKMKLSEINVNTNILKTIGLFSLPSDEDEKSFLPAEDHDINSMNNNKGTDAIVTHVKRTKLLHHLINYLK